MLMGHCATIRCISFFPDGCRLVAGTDAGSLHLWNFQSSSPSDEQWHAHSRRIHAVAVAHDGSKIASGSQDKHVNIWDPEDHTSPVMSWTCSAAVRSLSWHQDHQYLVVGLDDGKIQMINTSVNDKNLCSWISTDHLSVWCVIHSPDGTYLASAGSDGSVSVWDSMLREKIAGPFTHNGPVYSICWNDDGTQVVSASEDKTLKVWHATTGELMSTLCGHDDQVFTVTVSSHQGLLASGAGDGSVQLWEASTFRVAGSALRHESGIWCATFSPDGTWLACGSWTKPYVIYIYNISLPGSGRVCFFCWNRYSRLDLITGCFARSENDANHRPGCNGDQTHLSSKSSCFGHCATGDIYCNQFFSSVLPIIILCTGRYPQWNHSEPRK